MPLKYILLLFLFAGFGVMQTNAQSKEKENSYFLKNDAVPYVGAQVFIEPGQTDADIDKWFSVLKENHFTFCRIRMFESYMRDENYNWDFSLFDKAFAAADKYGIKIYATLFPYTEKTDIGGFKFPRSEKHFHEIAVYIENLVSHFKQYKSLAGWVLINEPGTGGSIPQNEFLEQKIKEWKAENPPKDFAENGYPVLVDLNNEAFLLDYNTWFLNWISEEIKKYDNKHDLHVNNHAIFSNLAEYDFPAWRKFLTSLGGSAHPSWHFSYFTRQKFSVAMSANCEIISSGAGELPWIITELQGGNNTYSGGNPICPTKEEIAQWLWIIYGSGSKGTIFWSLNPRSSGIEAGEWALLNFQDEPSDRMTTAGNIAEILQKNSELFQKAKKLESNISILYVHESLWAESEMVKYGSNYEARNRGGVIKSALGYFEAFSEMGITPNLKSLEEFDFSKNDYSGETIILSHQLAFPKKYVGSLEHFVANGGKLIVDGLTAFFDQDMHNTMKTGFDLENLLGGNVSEFKMVDTIFTLETSGYQLPAHLWKGFVVEKNGTPVFDDSKAKIGLRNSFGKGEVLWVPSLPGLGSRIENNYSELQKLLANETAQSLQQIPVQFEKPVKNVLMKTLVAGDAFITVLVNKDKNRQEVLLKFQNKKLLPEILYSTTSAKAEGKNVILEPEETKVIVWR